MPNSICSRSRCSCSATPYVHVPGVHVRQFHIFTFHMLMFGNSICSRSRCSCSAIPYVHVPGVHVRQLHMFTFQVFMFGVAGEKLTTRIRKMTFKTLLRQEVAYFDDSRHAVGVLCARLSSDASSVQGVGDRWSGGVREELDPHVNVGIVGGVLDCVVIDVAALQLHIAPR